jgi:hypothetical protein
VGTVWPVEVVPPDELLQAGQPLFAAVEDLEVVALTKSGLDPALGLAVGLGVIGPGPAVTESSDAADPAPRVGPVGTAALRAGGYEANASGPGGGRSDLIGAIKARGGMSDETWADTEDNAPGALPGLWSHVRPGHVAALPDARVR